VQVKKGEKKSGAFGDGFRSKMMYQEAIDKTTGKTEGQPPVFG
jgi:hypothetical protein